MKKKEIRIEIEEYQQLSELAADDKKLVEAAQKTALNAYAPYSEFKVGAAVLLANGTIITGNNQENAAYPSGLCAERTALFYAAANYISDDIITIAIAAYNKNGLLPMPVPPCGSCRQVMFEYENKQYENIRVILFGTDKIQVFRQASDLLPLVFDNNFLES